MTHRRSLSPHPIPNQVPTALEVEMKSLEYTGYAAFGLAVAFVLVKALIALTSVAFVAGMGVMALICLVLFGALLAYGAGSGL